MRKVVVTGLGAICPVGNDVGSMWSSFSSGKSGIGMLSRFDNSAGKVHVAAEVKNFDPLLYFEKSDIRKNDLYTQYAVGAAVQAMQESKLEGNIAPERLGVYVGSGIGGLNTTVTEAEKLFNGKRVSPFMIPMMISNMAAGTISIRFNAKGPTLPVVTACATASHTIGEAYRAIKHGYADAIIAGGSEASIMPLAVAGFTSCMALSTNPDPLTACRPFDKNRDGFVLGEGAGILVLEEYEHAKARGAKIYGELAGYGNMSDAFHITLPHPEAEGLANAINAALKEANMPIGKNTYVNAHGTSTVPNDSGETKAFHNAFGAAAKEVAISSTKSMIGHTLGAAGGLEAIACLKAMETGIVPPTLGLLEADPECDLDYTKTKAAKREIENAISTSLGFGGHNACLAFRKI